MSDETSINKDDSLADEKDLINELTDTEYKWGFVTDIEEEEFPKD